MFRTLVMVSYGPVTCDPVTRAWSKVFALAFRGTSMGICSSSHISLSLITGLLLCPALHPGQRYGTDADGARRNFLGLPATKR